jgi:hypothetical protein
MQQNEMINEFLDGGMMPADEDNFLLMLAADDELKSEFKRALFIENTLKEEAALIAPSTRSTMQLFSALGITYTNVYSDKTFMQKYSPLVLKYFKKAVPSIITAIIVSVAVSLYFSSKPENDVKLSGINDSFNHVSSTIASTPDGNGYPMMSSFNIEEENDAHPAFISTIKNKNHRINRVESADNHNNELRTNTHLVYNNNNKYIRSFDKSEIININSIPEQHSNISSSYINSFTDLYNQADFKKDSKKTGFTVSFSGTEDKSLKNVVLPETSHPVFSRNGIEILYNVNDNLKMGVDLRQEYFFQDYKTHINGTYYQIYQHPNLFTVGLATKLNITKLYKNTSLVTKLGLGLNEAGPVIRGMIGVDYDPSEAFGFSLGLENSNLFYFNDKKALYVTPKLGIVYSIKFNL